MKITLHGMASDNAGNTHKTGATLTVGDDRKRGHIAAARAEHLVGIGSATEAEDKKGNSK